jgi:TetR/AcrR family transcriptional regulator, regulator of cefoperazone and chloramphenicol sensitivity
MRSARQPDRSRDDLTTLARIRDAAIEHFARDGFQQTSLRSIAASAGVSASLIVHHFGSKSGLTSECDDFVVGIMVERVRKDSNAAGMQDVIGDYFANPGVYQTQMLYMARAITEDSPAATRFVDALVTESEAAFRRGIADGTMLEISDVRALAVTAVVQSLALLTIPPALARALGFDSMGPELMRRISLPLVELYTHGLYTDDSVLTTVRQALSDQPIPDRPIPDRPMPDRPIPDRPMPEGAPHD